jgi:hypothetical protein
VRYAQEFRRLSPEERWKQITELMEIGMNMVRTSPRRAEIERRMEAQEAEWRNLAALDDPRMRRLLELVSESRPTS